MVKAYIRSSAAVLACGFVLCSLPATAWAQTPPAAQTPAPFRYGATRRTLWINTGIVDFWASKAAQEAVTKYPIDRIIVPVFEEGQAAFLTRSAVFRSVAAIPDKTDPLAELIQAAHKKGIAVYGYINCFRWQSASRRGTEGGPLTIHPQWAEQSGENALRPTPALGYASPFHPEVRRHLLAFGGEIASRYPQLDGYLVRFNMPQTPMLAYNATVRESYIRREGIDPLDIAVADQTGAKDDGDQAAGTARVENAALLAAWNNDRLGQMADFVKQMTAALREKNGRVRVATLGYPRWYKFRVAQQISGLNDWLTWAWSGNVDGILLEAHWDEKANAEAYPFARSLVSKGAPDAHLTTLLPVRSGQTHTNLRNLFGYLREQGASSVALMLQTQADDTHALDFWQNLLPQIEAHTHENHDHEKKGNTSP